MDKCAGLPDVFFKPKIPFLVKFGGPGNGKRSHAYLKTVWNILRPFSIVWYSLWSFGIFFLFWYVWTKKNLATLHMWRMDIRHRIYVRSYVLQLMQSGPFFVECVMEASAVH
jgi:hypothetical protein